MAFSIFLKETHGLLTILDKLRAVRLRFLFARTGNFIYVKLCVSEKYASVVCIQRWFDNRNIFPHAHTHIASPHQYSFIYIFRKVITFCLIHRFQLSILNTHNLQTIFAWTSFKCNFIFLLLFVLAIRVWHHQKVIVATDSIPSMNNNGHCTEIIDVEEKTTKTPTKPSQHKCWYLFRRQD